MSDIDLNNSKASANLAADLISERRRDRFWKNLRFFLGLAIIVTMICLIALGKSNDDDKEIGVADGSGYIALVTVNGLITPSGSASAENLLPRLRKAFTDKEAKGVIIDINSPGGTPVQASIIHDEIIKLKKKYHKKVIVVGEDLLTSGAYYIAVSADKIYANANSTVGSIGVVMEGFGFNDLLKKVGIDRRAIYSGENKDRLDPFLPENPADVTKMKLLLEQVHNNFNQVVKDGRKNKLKGDDKALFSGDFWNGDVALQLGLIDSLGNLSDAMQNEFNVSHFKSYSGSNSMLLSILGQATSQFQLPIAGETLHLLEKL